jgi:hypothetical protein
MTTAKHFKVTVRAARLYSIDADDPTSAEDAAFQLAFPTLPKNWSIDEIETVPVQDSISEHTEYREKLLGMFAVIQAKEQKIGYLISTEPRLDTESMEALQAREEWMTTYGARLDRILARDEKE